MKAHRNFSLAEYPGYTRDWPSCDVGRVTNIYLQPVPRFSRLSHAILTRARQSGGNELVEKQRVINAAAILRFNLELLVVFVVGFRRYHCAKVVWHEDEVTNSFATVESF